MSCRVCKLRALLFGRGSSGDRMLRVDMHRAVKNVVQESWVYVSLCQPPLLQGWSLSSSPAVCSCKFFLHSYSPTCKTEPPSTIMGLVADLVDGLFYCNRPTFWFIFSSLWKSPWNTSTIILWMQCLISLISWNIQSPFLIALFLKFIYFYSVTIVCILPPHLPSTPANPTSLSCSHPPPWFCPCVLYSSSWKPFSPPLWVLLDCS